MSKELTLFVVIVLSVVVSYILAKILIPRYPVIPYYMLEDKVDQDA